ncbi:MAG: hypothetical protein LBM04_04715 [Opitutaceae bacterium]|nr:hypothetical protein [Opitutaceae bacterium]
MAAAAGAAVAEARLITAFTTDLGTLASDKAMRPFADASKPFSACWMDVIMTSSSMPDFTILMTSSLVMGAAIETNGAKNVASATKRVIRDFFIRRAKIQSACKISIN